MKAARGTMAVDWSLSGRALVHHLADLCHYSQSRFDEEVDRAAGTYSLQTQCLAIAGDWHRSGRHSVSAPHRFCAEAARLDFMTRVPPSLCEVLEIILPPHAVTEPAEGGSATCAYVYCNPDRSLFVATIYPRSLLGFELRKADDWGYALEPNTQAPHATSLVPLVKIVGAVHLSMSTNGERFPQECLTRGGRPIVNSHRILTLKESDKRMIPNSTTADDGSEYVKISRQIALGLEKGDVIYQPVSIGNGLTKHNEMRVESVEGGEAVRVMRVDGKDSKPRLIRIGELRIKKEDEPMTQPKSIKPLSAVPQSEAPRATVGSVGAKLDEMLAETEARIEELNAESDQLIKQLEERDTRNRARIEKLEVDLARAKKIYDDDRELVSAQADDIAAQLSDLIVRRDWLRSKPGSLK